MVNQMTLEQLTEALAIQDTPESWKRNWEQAQASYPTGSIPFLQPSYLESVCAYLSLPDDQSKAVLSTVLQIRNDDYLSQLAWLWHSILFVSPDYTREELRAWPVPANSDPSHAAMFPLIILLSGTTRLQEIYANRGIPDDIATDTIWDVSNAVGLCQERNGTIGINMAYFSWLMSHYTGHLYKVGRLQFRIQEFGNHLNAYRNIQTGHLAALSAPGIAYRMDGLLDGTNQINDTENSWISAFIESDGAVQGNPISPDGYASKELQTLNMKEWQLVLKPGDFLLDVHIPASGKLSQELYRDSYEQAITFFSSFFPEKQVKGYVCFTWLFDPQLRKLIGESSNIVQFQKDYHLFPIGGGDDAFYQFLFKCDKCEPHLLPERTSMQRTIKEFMLSGGRMRTSGGFILR
jgi:hypothetical protein